MEEKEYGFIKEGKVFRKAFLDYADKEIGEVKETEEAAVLYYTERFALAQTKVNEVEEKINGTENKGSYLMKVLHLKETLYDFDAIGDFEELYRKLDLLEEQLNSFIHQNRLKNLEIKTALLAELEEAVKSSEWKSATVEVKEVQRRWIKTGAVDDAEKERIEGGFKAMLDGFFERRAAFYADLEKMMKEKEANYEEFLDGAEKLKEIESYAVLVEKIRTLKEEWKDLGRIKAEVRTEFWNKFQAIIKSALAKAKKEGKAKVGNKKENLESRTEFLKELAVLNEKIAPVANVKELRDKWKHLGPVSRSEMDKLQGEFLFLIDQIAEKQFIESLMYKKLKGKQNEADKERVRLKIAYDLLHRDRAELSTFQENLEKFNTSSGLDKLIGGKLELQERKVKVKEEILRQFKAGA
ncbi:DUF349 domain-containing protein [Roseivirga sp.]|uniref:DUF349 domain-containing protein n=1 Tax=Roseivirga sp. TaxID=1964215 RepID=UPI002B279404|nr:DUF349 domain-containing protein [Roseivirga sp.]